MNMTMMDSREQHLQEWIGMGETRDVAALLDRHFPLAQGSHAEVRGYLVYFQHLLACFEDGSQTGLAQPSQFVALCGSRTEPEALLLKSGEHHIALLLARCGQDCRLDDVQLESHSLGLDTRSGELQPQWLSLCHSAPMPGCRFTAREGGEYRL
ncbi:aldolase/citrate lyase/malate synthase family protein [Shewanella cyperi]|uniref:malate synthase n=1 Tax=Shewanella cyperi TaxID=2814292 RepID=UPI001A9514A6|nr:malate synthase [Shewanella cyperi]QSX40189.1 malate synthase [Shewanella cyperi]